MHLFWTLEIIGDSAIDISHYVLSTTSFLKLIFVAAVVFSLKELRLPNFGKIWLSTVGIFTTYIAYKFQVTIISFMQ